MKPTNPDSATIRQALLRPCGQTAGRRYVLQGAPQRLPSARALAGRKGFVVAPFSVDEPLWFWNAVGEENFPEVQVETPRTDIKPRFHKEAQNSLQLSDYTRKLKQITKHLCAGRAEKTVLARTEVHTLHRLPLSADEKERLFRLACAENPQATVVLLDTPETGTWLFATPELLLARTGSMCRTMALAGSRKRLADGTAAHPAETGSHLAKTGSHLEKIGSHPVKTGSHPAKTGSHPVSPRPEDAPNECLGEAPWTEKNLHEHAEVVRFIAEILGRWASGIEQAPAETTPAAGGIEHLRTRFAFTLPDGTSAAEVVADLHPTPATCGFPRKEAREIIDETENFARYLYAGFFGMYDDGGDFALYVALRGMHLTRDAVTLYAGGGIMPESQVQDEWDETERKLLPMRRLLPLLGIEP